MPTSKKRITITITGQVERDLEIIWQSYPNLQGNELETIVFVLTLKASEILTGQSTTPRIERATEPLAPQESEPVTDNDENEWSD